MKKICGVIGGMGPLATSDLFNKIVINTKANKDSEHLRIIIDNNTTVPDRTNYLMTGNNSPLPEIINTGKKLKEYGVDFLIIPCNTSHYFYDEISNSIDIPVINMIDEVYKELSKSGIKKVGLLATTGTVKFKVYEKYLKDIEIILPNDQEQEKVMNYIYQIKSGNVTSDIFDVINNLKNQGIEALILGCTELPYLLNDNNTGIKCIDSTLVLAKSAIRFAGYEVKEDTN